jgi:integrase
MFNLAIDSKLRGRDVVALKVEDIAPHGYAIDRATVRQRKTGQPVRFEVTEQTRQAVDDYIRATGKKPGGDAGSRVHRMRACDRRRRPSVSLHQRRRIRSNDLGILELGQTSAAHRTALRDFCAPHRLSTTSRQVPLGAVQMVCNAPPARHGPPQLFLLAFSYSDHILAFSPTLSCSSSCPSC